MKFYGVDMQGFLKLTEYANTTPAYNTDNARSLIYVNDQNNTTDRVFIAGKQAAGWVELQTTSGLNDYYTAAQTDAKYVQSADPNFLDSSEWIDRVVWDAAGPGAFPIPSNATEINVAANGVNYNNTVGTLSGVKRDASGDIFANIGHLTATSAQYADLAEKYTCDESISIGTVMEVDFNSDDEVVECQFELSTSVLGVVSDSPAYLMNSDSEGLPIALTGKVPVRIIGAVSKGDFIVPAGDGLARKGQNSELPYRMGVVLKSNLDVDEKLVMCVVK